MAFFVDLFNFKEPSSNDDLTIWGEPSHGKGPKIPIAIGNISHLGRLSQENFGEACRIINQVTLTPFYPLGGGSRDNHNGTHSARQARMIQLVLKVMGESASKLLSDDEKMHLQLAAYCLRSGRVDETTHLDPSPDDYNTRSAMIYEAYANQLAISPETVALMRKLIVDSCRMSWSAQKVASSKTMLCYRALTVVHELDLIRCYGPEDIDWRVQSLVRGYLSSYIASSCLSEQVKKLFRFSKELCIATGEWSAYDGIPRNWPLFSLCSQEGDICWKKVQAAKCMELGDL